MYINCLNCWIIVATPFACSPSDHDVRGPISSTVVTSDLFVETEHYMNYWFLHVWDNLLKNNFLQGINWVATKSCKLCSIWKVANSLRCQSYRTRLVWNWFHVAIVLDPAKGIRNLFAVWIGIAARRRKSQFFFWKPRVLEEWSFRIATGALRFKFPKVILPTISMIAPWQPCLCPAFLGWVPMFIFGPAALLPSLYMLFFGAIPTGSVIMRQTTQCHVILHVPPSMGSNVPINIALKKHA